MNEKTGEIAAKRVTNTSVRADIWTRKLSFDKGAVLETTDEHTLYVEGRGFVKAKEVGIGSALPVIFYFQNRPSSRIHKKKWAIYNSTPMGASLEILVL